MIRPTLVTTNPHWLPSEMSTPARRVLHEFGTDFVPRFRIRVYPSQSVRILAITALASSEATLNVLSLHCVELAFTGTHATTGRAMSWARKYSMA